MESNRLGTFDSQNFVWYSDVFNRGFMTPDGLQNPTSACEAGRRAEHHADQQYPGTTADNDLGPAELRGHANGQILG